MKSIEKAIEAEKRCNTERQSNCAKDSFPLVGLKGQETKLIISFFQTGKKGDGGEKVTAEVWIRN